MKFIAFIEARQADVIRKILEHCGLRQGSVRETAASVARARMQMVASVSRQKTLHGFAGGRSGRAGTPPMG